MKPVQIPEALSDGDLVAVVSPASWPSEEGIEGCMSLIRSWGFEPRLGTHASDQLGYLAGRDEDRLSDLNEAIRDPMVRAIVTTRGGCGSSRLLHGVDVEALAADPKPLIGYSDITALHRVWHAVGVPSLHGAAAGRHADILDQALRGATPAPVTSDPTQYGASLTTEGRASGNLFGGNLEMLARSVGVLPFDLDGHVLLLEVNKAAGLGMVDRALTQLMMSGALDGVVGVALGWLTGFEDYEDRAGRSSTSWPSGWAPSVSRFSRASRSVMIRTPWSPRWACRAPWMLMPECSRSRRRWAVRSASRHRQ